VSNPEKNSPEDTCLSSSTPGSLEADRKSLKELSIRGGVITLITQAFSYVISVGSTVILARLLTPQDYGTVAMVTALTAFVGLFKDLGLSGATIQSRSISRDQINSLFWINAGLGLFVMIVIMAFSPLVAWFYKKPELLLVTIGLSFSSFFNSLGTQHGALLNRQMRFKALAYVQLPAQVAGFISAIVVALLGGKYWALVANQVVTAICNTVGVWIASDFRPKRPRRGANVRKLVHFGAHIAGFDVAYYFRDNVDQILVGRVWGSLQLGLYNRALALLTLPLSSLRYPLNKVALPAMSQLVDDPQRYRSYYVKYASLLAFVSMPFIAVLFACSDSIIRLFLGPKWLGAVAIFRILALAGFISTVASLRTTVIISSGHGARLLRWGILNTIASVAGYAGGLPWGAKGVAIATCIVTYLTLHPLLIYAFKDTHVRLADFYQPLLKPSLASIVMCVLYLTAIKPFFHASDVLILMISIPLCFLLYLGLIFLFPGGRANISDYWSYINLLVRRPTKLDTVVERKGGIQSKDSQEVKAPRFSED
jgi:O-antigen/teichoic acid export membrane protein